MGADRPAIVLLSGGLDSATTLAIARAEGFAVHALTFRYGQTHAVEVDAARRVAASLGAAGHETVDLPDLGRLGRSALTGHAPIPKGRSDGAIARGIPATYVPARNTVFLSCALAWAEVLGADDLFVGVNAIDYSGYPDCRPEYLAAFEAMANLATKAATEDGRRLQIHAPLIDLTKAEIIRRGVELGVDYALTVSCYDPRIGAAGRPAACGACDSCRLRARGFAEAGIADPAGGSP